MTAHPLHRIIAPLPAQWVGSVYVGAGEMTGAFVPSARSSWHGVRGQAANPDGSRARSDRRRRAALRRYAVTNGCDRMITLTRADQTHDLEIVRADVAAFWRTLRGLMGGAPMPYVHVFERHKSGAWHVHGLVNQYVARSKIIQAWSDRNGVSHGFVHIKRISDLPVGSTRRDSARAAASYLTGGVYLSKQLGENAEFARHAYEVGQGFQPVPVRVVATSGGLLIGKAASIMGGQPAFVWRSSEHPDYIGPPAVFAKWH